MHSCSLLNILFCYSLIALPLFMDALITYISAKRIFNNSTGCMYVYVCACVCVCAHVVSIKSDRKGESRVGKILRELLHYAYSRDSHNFMFHTRHIVKSLNNHCRPSVHIIIIHLNSILFYKVLFRPINIKKCIKYNECNFYFQPSVVH